MCCHPTEFTFISIDFDEDDADINVPLVDRPGEPRLYLNFTFNSEYLWKIRLKLWMLFINRHPFALKSVHIIYNFNFLNIFHLFNCLLIGFKLKICFVLFIIYWSQLLFYLFYQIIRIIFTFRFVKHEFIVLLCVCVTFETFQKRW